jgi:hypothetical protein
MLRRPKMAWRLVIAAIAVAAVLGVALPFAASADTARSGREHVSPVGFTRKIAAGRAQLHGQRTTAPMRATLTMRLPKRCASLSGTAASPAFCLSTQQLERLLSTIDGVTRRLKATTGRVTGGSNSNVIIINVAVIIGHRYIGGVGNGTNKVKNGIGAQRSGAPRTGENGQD